MKTLGTLFLITAALLVVGVIINLSPSGSEERIYKSEEALHEASQNLKNFAEAGRALGYQTGQIDIRSDRDIFSTSSSLKSQREMRVFYFAIAAGILGIVGLILVVSQSQRQSYHTPSVKPQAVQSQRQSYHTPSVKSQAVWLSNTEPISKQDLPKAVKPEAIDNIFLYVNGEVKGPHSSSEIQFLIHDGYITYQTLCCLEGSEDWRPLSEIVT
jgi:hypothetical protein